MGEQDHPGEITPFCPSVLGANIVKADFSGSIHAPPLGAPGDIAIMELVEGPVSFLDTRTNKRDGVQTVINGVPFGRPYQAPFAVR
jgi:hypothetical protein